MEEVRKRQIANVQAARWDAIKSYGERIGQSPRKGWKGPSEASIETLKKMIDEHRRLTAKGKGRKQKKRTQRRRRS